MVVESITKTFRIPSTLWEALEEYADTPAVLIKPNAIVVQALQEFLQRKKHWPPKESK